VGRTYAGILGSLAMAVTLLRGVMAGGGVDETLVHGLIAMIVFMAIGFTIGAIADWMIEEAVYEQVGQEVAAQESQQHKR
jgi:hypothetical protein